jgi:hypothetical protein
MFKGDPSFGECVDLCSHCKTERPELDEYIKTLAGKQNEKKEPCPTCGQIKNIIKGFGKLAWERIAKGQPDESTVKRAEICSQCEYRTFLPVTEWSIDAGLDFIKTKLLGMQKKDLPINHEPGEWDALWCARCKCCIEAKIRVPDEKCPLNKWPEMELNHANQD